MKVKVFPPVGCDRSVLDDKCWMEVPEGEDVCYVLKSIKCGRLKAKMLLVSVNGERADFHRELNDGDVVGFLMPFTGG